MTPIQAEKAKERKWKNLAQEYRQQVEEDKGSAEDAMKKLEDALKYMNTKGGGGGASSGKTSGTARESPTFAKARESPTFAKAAHVLSMETPDPVWVPPRAEDNSLCDKTGCWEVDTADATTQDTIKKFKEAGRRAQSGGAGSAVADAQVAAASGQLAARNAAASLSGKPLQNTLQNTCSSPWKSSAASSACSGKPCVAGACSYVRQRCPQRSGLFNYLSLPYCTMPLMPGLALFLLVMWMVILSVWLALAADAFLCPNLSVISKECRMSDAVAGLTFLAFGNGAPDIFSMIAAAIASPKGAEMSLGEVMGSSLFVACVVMGIIAIGMHTNDMPSVRIALRACCRAYPPTLRRMFDPGGHAEFCPPKSDDVVVRVLPRSGCDDGAPRSFPFYPLGARLCARRRLFPRIARVALLHPPRLLHRLDGVARVCRCVHCLHCRCRLGYIYQEGQGFYGERIWHALSTNVPYDQVWAGKTQPAGLTSACAVENWAIIPFWPQAEAAAERSKEKGLLSVDPNALAAHRKNPPSARQESAIGALVRYISVGVGHEEVSKEPSGIASKILGGVRSPAMVVMRLSNPVVDMSKLDEGWCKPAALCQITLSPLLIIW